MSATANPSPAWESTATQIKISELKQDHMRHTLEKLRSESSGLVLFTAQWRNLEEHFEAVRAELIREMEDYELRRKQMEWKQKYLKQKAKEIETREARLGEESRRVEERGREIDATYELVRRCYEVVREKERELEERETRVERKAARVKMRERKVDEVEIRAARAEEKVELREKDLEVREMEVRERIDEVEFKEKELGVREIEVGKRIEEVELREKDLGVREMEVRKRIEEIELKEEFVAGLRKGGGGIVVDEKYEVFRMRAVRHVEELELRERNVEVVERELAKRFDEVVLKEKRLAETMEEFKRGEQELEERIREVDSRKRLKSVICCAENESPIDDGESEGSGDASYANIRFNVTMDGRALQMFLNGRVNDHETLRGEVVGGLQMSHDPAKLVLDAMHGFYADDFEGDDAGFDLNVVRRSCILLLEQLMLLNRRIKNPVRERAMELAVKWKWKMTAVREHYLEVVGFLQLVASYGLATGLDKDELVEFVVTAVQHPHAPTLCRSLGLADKVPDIIQKLIDCGQPFDAIKLVFDFKLPDRFPPVPILRAYLHLTFFESKEICSAGGLTIEKECKVIDTKLDALVAVLKCVKEYKLDSEYPVDKLRQLMLLLRMQKSKYRSQLQQSHEIQLVGDSTFTLSSDTSLVPELGICEEMDMDLCPASNSDLGMTLSSPNDHLDVKPSFPRPIDGDAIVSYSTNPTEAATEQHPSVELPSGTPTMTPVHNSNPIPPAIGAF